MSYEIRALHRDDVKSHFDCGVPELNTYFKKYAIKNGDSGISRTFVLLSDNVICGFYALCMSNVESAKLPPAVTKLPGYPIPVALIAQLAVDKNHRRKDFGGALLFDSFKRSLSFRDDIGIYGIVTDARDQDAVNFYKHFDFVLLEECAQWPRRMFIAMTVLQTLFQQP